MKRFRKAAIICPPSFTMLIDAGPVETLLETVRAEYPDARLEIVTDRKRWQHINRVAERYVCTEQDFTWGDFYPHDIEVGEVDDIPIEAPLATCIGCGCDDENACFLGCHWLKVDYDSGRGVCSECPGALDLFSAHELEEDSSTC